MPSDLSILKDKKAKKYYTQDNGGFPFIVVDKGNKVVVIQQEWDQKKRAWVPSKKVLDVKYKKLFVGDDPMKFSPYWERSFKGNSVLVQETAKRHIFVGDRIFAFEPVKGDSIKKYISVMGNSSVPYPYAIGDTHTYLMIEHVYVENGALDLKKDVYAQYYGFDSHKDEKKRIEKATHKLKEKVLVKRVV